MGRAGCVIEKITCTNLKPTWANLYVANLASRIGPNAVERPPGGIFNEIYPAKEIVNLSALESLSVHNALA